VSACHIHTKVPLQPPKHLEYRNDEGFQGGSCRTMRDVYYPAKSNDEIRDLPE
jgi:hypothetical protein